MRCPLSKKNEFSDVGEGDEKNEKKKNEIGIENCIWIVLFAHDIHPNKILKLKLAFKDLFFSLTCST